MDVTSLARTAVGMNDYAKAAQTGKLAGMRPADKGEATGKAGRAYDVQLSAAALVDDEGEFDVMDLLWPADSRGLSRRHAPEGAKSG